jgi:hypothetical protein
MGQNALELEKNVYKKEFVKATPYPLTRRFYYPIDRLPPIQNIVETATPYPKVTHDLAGYMNVIYQG